MGTRRRCSSTRRLMIVRGGPSWEGFWRMLTWRVEPVDQYLRTFQWNKIKYRADKSIADLIDSLQKVPLPFALESCEDEPC